MNELIKMIQEGKDVNEVDFDKYNMAEILEALSYTSEQLYGINGKEEHRDVAIMSKLLAEGERAGLDEDDNIATALKLMQAMEDAAEAEKNEQEDLCRALRCSASVKTADIDCTKCKYRLLEPLDDTDLFNAEVIIDGVEYWESCDCDKIALDAANMIERLAGGSVGSME